MKTQTVRPDGKIAFPLVGDIQARALTPDELREQIAQRIARYVKNPEVTVIVTTYNSKKISVLGEVKNPACSGCARTSTCWRVSPGREG